MKGRLSVYVPVKTDATDVGLAEFMNNFPDKSKLKIMFDREKESIYMFGTRRVTIKVNRGKPQVKIGGGFMPIEDFIDQHGPAELEKLECRDPLNKLLNPAAPSQSAALNGDELSVNMSKSNMRRLDSKSSVKTSTTKTPLKKKGN